MCRKAILEGKYPEKSTIVVSANFKGSGKKCFHKLSGEYLDCHFILL